MPTPLAYAALVAAAALWGSNPVAAKWLQGDVPPIALSWLRWLIALCVLSPVAWPERRALAAALRGERRILVPLALLANVPQSALVYKGLETTTALNVGLLNSTIPVLILVLAAVWFARRPATHEAFGIAVSFLGVAVILFQGSPERVLALSFNGGDLLAFGAMLTWAFYTLLLPRRPSLPLPAFIAAMCLVALVLTLPAVLLEATLDRMPVFSPRSVAGLAYISIGPTLLGTLAYSFGVERAGAVRAGLFIHLMPVFASILSVTVLGERLHPYHFAGFVLVAGGALAQLGWTPLLSSPPQPRKN
jgi:drug/metabolite transporter (DMT)-like permease